MRPSSHLLKHQMIMLHRVALSVSAVLYPGHLLPSEGSSGHCLHEAFCASYQYCGCCRLAGTCEA